MIKPSEHFYGRGDSCFLFAFHPTEDPSRAILKRDRRLLANDATAGDGQAPAGADEIDSPDEDPPTDLRVSDAHACTVA